MLRVNPKEINPGDTFLTLPGDEEEKNKNIEDAIDKGAVCIITDKGEYEVKTIITNDTKTYLSNYLKELYYEKIEKIKLIGIVGTTGKTITEDLIAQMLNNLNSKTAYLNEQEFYIDDYKKEIKLDIYKVYECINKAIDENCDNIIIELPSNLIKERQFEGLRFDIVVYTNLIDDNPSEEYINTKIEPFKMIKKDGYAIINKNDKYYDKFVFPQNNNIYFGTEDSNYKISNINLKYDSIEFLINNQKIELKMLGSYNIYNYLAAYITAKALKYDDEDILESTKKINQVKGTFYGIKHKDSLVIIDSAKKFKQISSIIKYTKEFSIGRIITIIGCEGDKNKEERPKIGKLVTQNTDYVIFTSDNPRYEEEANIINEMIKDVNGDNYEIITNRKEAIKKGISILKERDILLLLGKGNEEYQIIGNDKLTFSDYKEVRKHVKK